jgi:tRNA pseudouridine55 synthase
VGCSPGTYIRSLAADLGECLGSGAFLSALVRLSSGRFALEDAVSLERLEEAFQHGHEDQYLLPLDEAFLEWPAMIVGADAARRIVHGQSISRSWPAGDGIEGQPLCRVYGPEGDFLAIMIHDAASGQWQPKKVFAS